MGLVGGGAGWGGIWWEGMERRRDMFIRGGDVDFRLCFLPVLVLFFCLNLAHCSPIYLLLHHHHHHRRRRRRRRRTRHRAVHPDSILITANGARSSVTSTQPDLHPTNERHPHPRAHRHRNRRIARSTRLDSTGARAHVPSAPALRFAAGAPRPRLASPRHPHALPPALHLKHPNTPLAVAVALTPRFRRPAAAASLCPLPPRSTPLSLPLLFPIFTSLAPASSSPAQPAFALAPRLRAARPSSTRKATL